MDNTISSNAINSQGEKTTKPVVDQLTEGQKKGLLNGALLLGGVITGGSLYAMYSAGDISIIETSAPVEEGSEEGIEIGVNTDPELGMSVNDDMPFSEAFSTARDEVGAGGVFEWKGNMYNTYTKEEWEGMSEMDKDSYAEAVSDHIRSRSIAVEEPSGEIINPIESTAVGSEESTEGISDPIATKTVGADAPEELIDLNELLVFPEVKYKDVNHDGIVDAIAIDVNEDGYADAIAIDINQDGELDLWGENIDDDIEIDIVVVESGDGGMIANKYLEADSVIEMDQFDEVLETHDTAEVIDEPNLMDDGLSDSAEQIII